MFEMLSLFLRELLQGLAYRVFEFMLSALHEAAFGVDR